MTTASKKSFQKRHGELLPPPVLQSPQKARYE